MTGYVFEDLDGIDVGELLSVLNDYEALKAAHADLLSSYRDLIDAFARQLEATEHEPRPIITSDAFLSSLPKTEIDYSGFVYAIRCGDFVKVGCAADPHKRLKQLQVGSPNTLSLHGVIKSDNMKFDEKAMHRELQRFHHQGEWFYAAPEVTKLFDGAQNAN